MAGHGTIVHPLLACADAIEAALKDAAHVDPTFMPTDAKAEVLSRLARLESGVASLRLKVLAAADDVALRDGARDAGAWLAHTDRRDPRAASADLDFAEGLERRWQAVGAALTDGSVNLEQARVIVGALDDLPADVDDDIVVRAEVYLVEQAEEFGPRQLRMLGRRVLEVVAPEVVEAEEGRRLEQEERRARERTRLSLCPLGDGMTRLTADLPDAAAYRLETYLDAFTSPRTSPESPAGEERIPRARRLGQAFCSLLERVDPDRLPEHGGDATTVMVTIELEQLTERLGTAALLGGEKVTAGEARRLACNADLVPVVLGADSEILDLGRTARLFSRAQRKALRVRDQQCRGEGCTVPAAWCEAHHRQPWARGGATDLVDGVLFCSFHHHRAHDPQYELVELPGGEFRFRRRR